jgi:3-deoxy-7-phosphoheptulonate synthase
MSLTIETTLTELEDSSLQDETDRLLTVKELRCRHPLRATASRTVAEARREFTGILAGSDPRLVLIVGPCSIHDPEAALQYGRRILRLRELYGETFLILMRTYLEKPRTTVGWKGFISDPSLDGSCAMNQGLDRGRKLLADLAEMGVPSATELVDPAVTPYIEDLIAWASIGARTAESQVHRQLVSGLAMPVGFKNGTQGNIRLAVDAIVASRHRHVFPTTGLDGSPRLLRTTGNPSAHLVLRGGRVGSSYIPNWMPEVLAETSSLLEATDLPGRVMVDCSHANSAYNPAQQMEVADALVSEARRGRSALFGLMLESNLQAGQQKLNGSPASLAPGVSITDPCIGMDQTEEWIDRAARLLA